MKQIMVRSRTASKNSQVIKFVVIGVIGTAINTVVLYLLSWWAGLPLAVDSALAVELAAISNYLLNDSWTLAARTPTFRRFAKFNVAVLMVTEGRTAEARRHLDTALQIDPDYAPARDLRARLQ